MKQTTFRKSQLFIGAPAIILSWIILAILLIVVIVYSAAVTAQKPEIQSQVTTVWSVHHALYDAALLPKTPNSYVWVDMTKSSKVTDSQIKEFKEYASLTTDWCGEITTSFTQESGEVKYETFQIGKETCDVKNCIECSNEIKLALPAKNYWIRWY
jgi:hypothetical protein